MAYNSDYAFERSYLLKSSRFWRFLTFVLMTTLAFYLFWPSNLMKAQHVARVHIQGVIYNNPHAIERINDLSKDTSVKAVILNINSPGGSTVGSQALYEALAELGRKKPLVVTMGSLAASGGYAAALAGQHIFAYGNTLTGSIGVIMSWFNVGEALHKIGVEQKSIASSPLKGQPNGFQDASPEVIASWKKAIDTSYQWFFDLVRTQRHLSWEQTKAIADGRVFTGWQAVKNGLVDELGGEKEARAWLFKHRYVSKDLPIRDYALDKKQTLISQFFGTASRAMASFSTSNEGLISKIRKPSF